MNITFGNSELHLTPVEVTALNEFAAANPEYKDAEHLIELHISRLVDHALTQHPNAELKAAIKAAEAEAQAKLKLAMDAVRSPRPKTSAKLAEDIARVSPKEAR